MSEQQLIRGTMILTASIFLSKMLGLIYVFPFTAIVGHKGLALYTYGYTPYTVLLSLATLGVPLAVSKFVSKYNALGDYRTGQRLLKSGLVVMSITGFIAFLVLFFLAGPIAHQVLDPENMEGNTVADTIFTIRMVSVALLVVPVMALIRGYFQGHQSMGPTAVSQVVEQLIRIIFILLLTYLIINVFGGELGIAVGFATFGAFVGAVAGLAVLLFYWRRRWDGLQKQIDESTVDHQIPLPKMYKELFAYALPISFVGLSIPLYQTVDLITFNPAMMATGISQAVTETYYASFTQASHKLILIPVALATAMSLTIIPTVTNAFINDEKDRLQRTITQTFQIILFLTVPAATGLMVLAEPAYGALFGLEEVAIGSDVLRFYAPVAIAFSIFAVTSALLQGINKQKYAVIALLAGLAFKVSGNSLLISWFAAHGAIIATGTGYLIAIAVNLWAVHKFAEYNFTFVLKRFLLICIFTAGMAAVVAFLNYGFQQIIPVNSRWDALLILTVSVVAGIAVYLNISVRSGLAGQILGHRFDFLNKK
ncbi:polysaccharide biosynthesis protein [Salipaludibacillus sp. CUR1]|uniref:putative polysaccharide biosynthesis protein n=1 Tax=Salipaludibacillus sp. CUR1 TaxID=2820003 RepID=UPI001E4C9A5E|nr:polysaccharide biosynthesis protein [Salipaludibacillus sp. CUR1]MCE7791455.1 polysaccharide biosynthesis protein [Salipaludibacillus sp. CUR1]